MSARRRGSFGDQGRVHSVAAVRLRAARISLGRFHGIAFVDLERHGAVAGLQHSAKALHRGRRVGLRAAAAQSEGRARTSGAGCVDGLHRARYRESRTGRWRSKRRTFATRLVEIEQQRAEAGVDPLSELLQARLSGAQIRLKRIHLETRAANLGATARDADRAAAGLDYAGSCEHSGDSAR